MDSQKDAEAGIKRPAVYYSTEACVRPVNQNSDHKHAGGKPPSVTGTDDEDDEENYDWSTEEDLVDEGAKFEQGMGSEKPQKGWGPKRYIALTSPLCCD